jgi:CheY-like chemotaxis protein
MGMIELLRSTALDREQQGYLETLSQSAEALLVTLNATLELSALATAPSGQSLRSFSPRQLAEETAALMRPLAQAKHLPLLLWCEDLPEQVVGEPGRLQQLWLNLLSNAIKFTDRGEIRFKLHCSPAAEGTDAIALNLIGTISDTGRGISRAQQEKIRAAFDDPEQLGGSALDAGLGLGLSIAARLAQRLRAAFALESEPGNGTRMRLSVPVEQAPQIVGASLTEAQQNEQLAALSVLVVEDNPVHQMLVLALLKRMGIQAALAQDGAQALACTREHRFDVILMDLEMPVMDGEAATRAIRTLESDGDNHSWIIAMTARAFDEDRARCRAAGMDDFVSKPFRQEGLRDALLQRVRQGASGTPGALVFRPGPGP